MKKKKKEFQNCTNFTTTTGAAVNNIVLLVFVKLFAQPQLLPVFRDRKRSDHK